MCRYGCLQLSKIKPVLEAQNIKLVAIGMEESLDDFVEGLFFSGDIYIDKGAKCYQELKLKTLGVFQSLVDSRIQAAYKLAGQIPQNWNDIISHGSQLGATFVVGAGGTIIFEHRQEHHGDHVDNNAILRALNLPEVEPTPVEYHA
jgi:prostamide/prostaglandin F2alpha synthase